MALAAEGHGACDAVVPLVGDGGVPVADVGGAAGLDEDLDAAASSTGDGPRGWRVRRAVVAAR